MRKWWVSFESGQALEWFVREFDGSEVDGVRVRSNGDWRVEASDGCKKVARAESNEDEELDLSCLNIYKTCDHTDPQI